MKSFIRLVREIRAAKLAGLIENYCMESGYAYNNVYKTDTILYDTTRNYIKLELCADITLQTAETLKTYLLKNFYDIEKIVLINGPYVELLIFPKQHIQVQTQLSMD